MWGEKGQVFRQSEGQQIEVPSSAVMDFSLPPSPGTQTPPVFPWCHSLFPEILPTVCKIEKLVDERNKLVGSGGHAGFGIAKCSRTLTNIDYFVEHAIILHQKTMLRFKKKLLKVLSHKSYWHYWKKLKGT